MAKDVMTDLQVEMEIERLLASELVLLAKKEQRIKNKRRQYMYSLRCMERRGRELAAQGATLDTLEQMLRELESDAAESEG